VDGSGTLDREELKAILTRGATGMGHLDADGFISMFDTDQDGKISIEELVAACTGFDDSGPAPAAAAAIPPSEAAIPTSEVTFPTNASMATWGGGPPMGPAPQGSVTALRALRAQCLERGGGTMRWEETPEDVREWFRTKWWASGQLASLELNQAGDGLKANMGWHCEVARALAEFGELGTLHLGGNEMGDRCLAYYIPALAACPQLEHISLYGNALTADCIGALVAALPPTLKHLDLSSNLLGAAGAAALAGADGGNVSHLVALQTLKLSANGWDPAKDESRIFRDAGALALAPALRRLPALAELHLEANFVNAEGKEAVRSALDGRPVKVHWGA